MIRPPNLMVKGLDAFFTTRSGNPASITRWKGRTFHPIQRHTDNIHIFKDLNEKVIADAVITRERGVLIGVQVADCVPILLYDKDKHVVSAVHAGWRGTAKEILKKTIETMLGRYNANREDILIAIGPSIKGCCYEVGIDVIEAIHRVTGEGEYYKKIKDRYYLDLSTVNMMQASSMGIPGGNIWYSEECTYCNPSRFYSYRYEGVSTGRQGGFIGMW